MMPELSSNTQAVLLLTAPLIVGRGSKKADSLSAGEYKRLAFRLHEAKYKPADLLSPKPEECLQACKTIIDTDRLKSLLARGFQLSQALEHWRARAIWVLSRADSQYPQRIKSRLRADAPAILYGCGDMELLDGGGLAVVGSRHVEDALIDFTMGVGRLAAQAGTPIVSGGAKGIDQASMRGALEAGGNVCGVLADSLEKQVMNREHRNLLLDGQLALISPYDPNARFNVGHAMQRNKLIYALADASLVVNADVGKGGTWAGAIEQLDKLKFVPVYVRNSGRESSGLDELRKKGAISWPNPKSVETFTQLIDQPVGVQSQEDLALFGKERSDSTESATDSLPISTQVAETSNTLVSEFWEPSAKINVQPKIPSEELFKAVRYSIKEILRRPMRDSEVSETLAVNITQARSWLKRLVDEGLIEKKKKPVTYVVKEEDLFD